MIHMICKACREFNYIIKSSAEYPYNCYRNYGIEFDEIVGSSIEYPYICCSESAFMRAGLTYTHSSVIEVWTLCADKNRIETGYTKFFFNPLLYEHFGEDCNPSRASHMIRNPTQERAIVEGIFYREYMDEGILIEGLRNYIYSHNDDCSKLYELAPKYMLKEKDLTYWLNEAREEVDM